MNETPSTSQNEAVDALVSNLVLYPNARRKYNAQNMRELEASIKKHGIIEPLLCRKKAESEDIYEIIAGQRRFTAGKKVGLKTLPIVVRVITDEEITVLQLIENIQREDMHPMEEANAIVELMKLNGNNTQVVAGKIGKPVRFVAERLQLQNLSASLQKQFLAKKIAERDALVISALPEDQQKKVEQWMEERHFSVSPRDVREYVANMLLLDLRNAPFDLNDATLVPEAGACSACPKRTDAKGELRLFEDMANPCCMDKECFKAKKNAYCLLKIQQAPANAVRISTQYSGTGDAIGTAKYHDLSYRTDKTCPHVEVAVVVDSYTSKEIGQLRDICREKNCPVHGTKQSTDAKERDRVKKAAADKTTIINECLASYTKDKAKFSLKYLTLLVEAFSDVLSQDQFREVAKRMNIQPSNAPYDRYASGFNAVLKACKKPEELATILIHMALSTSDKSLQDIAKEDFGIDVKALLKAKAAEQKAFELSLKESKSTDDKKEPAQKTGKPKRKA